MKLWRPRPPDDLVTITNLALPDRFVPAPELWDWIGAAYLDEAGALHNPEHAHLKQAQIACLWTTAENKRRLRRIVGEAEMPERYAGKLSRWVRARVEQQLVEWFGLLPDFLLTFDAVHCAEVEDASFCALVDHELYHCAQQRDEFGGAKFNKATGAPLWTLRGHDVEEFVGVVRRFGVEAAGEAATDLVIAAAGKPEIGVARVAQACGTCLRAVA